MWNWHPVTEPFGRSRYEIFIGHWLMVKTGVIGRCHESILQCYFEYFPREGTFITQKKSTEGPMLLRVWCNLKPFCTQYSSSIGPFLTIWSSFPNSPTTGHLTKNNPKRFQGSMTCQRWKVQCVERVVGGGRCSIAWFTPRVVEQTFRPHPEQPLPIDIQQTIKGIHFIVGYADCLGCVQWMWYATFLDLFVTPGNSATFFGDGKFLVTFFERLKEKSDSTNGSNLGATWKNHLVP